MFEKSKLFEKYSKTIILFILIIVIFIIMLIFLPDKFFTLVNFQSITFQIPEFGFLVCAMMVVMITGGIDLSIVSIASISGITAALIMTKLITPEKANSDVIGIIIFAILSAMIVSIVCGLINGLLIAYVDVPPILATLGTMSLFAGIGIIITGSRGVTDFPEKFLLLGNGVILKIPIPFIVFMCVVFLIALILNTTSFGLSLYMIGSNPVASKFSGINNKIILIKAYMLSGLLSGISSLIMISRVNSAKSGYGEGYLLQSIIVVILGGVNPSGGFGSMSGVVIGIIILQMLQSGFNILGVSVFAKNIIFGMVLIIVMIINFYIAGLKTRIKKI